jgi:hypothetical protein
VGKSSFRIQVVQRAFKVAHSVLLSYVAEPALPAPSLLATILPPTGEMFERRRLKRRIERRRQAGRGDSREPPSASEPRGMDQPLASKRALPGGGAPSPAGKRQRDVSRQRR